MTLLFPKIINFDYYAVRTSESSFPPRAAGSLVPGEQDTISCILYNSKRFNLHFML